MTAAAVPMIKTVVGNGSAGDEAETLSMPGALAMDGEGVWQAWQWHDKLVDHRYRFESIADETTIHIRQLLSTHSHVNLVPILCKYSNTHTHAHTHTHTHTTQHNTTTHEHTCAHAHVRKYVVRRMGCWQR